MVTPEDLPTANYAEAVESTKAGLGEPSTIDLAGETRAYEPQPPAKVNRPREIGNYVIIEEIARGGMGVVYKAHQRGLNRIVALKMTLAGDFAGAEERQRFRLEAEAAGQLDHPCIVPIYDVSEHEGNPFFSMGFVEGESLRGLLNAGPLPIQRAAEITQMVARAVHYAHMRGIVHRDLKPANILIDAQGQPRVTDFGLAKQVSANSELTNTGQILGTPSFMPPEQAQGNVDQVGPLADVYSLGATFYCLLTGRPPFQAASLIDTLMQVIHQEPASPRTLDNSIPRDVETICLKCLEKSPSRRYANAEELADDIDRFLRNEPVHARPLSRLHHVWRWCQRKPAAAGLIVALFLLLGVMLVTIWFRSQVAATAERLEHTEALKKLSDYYAGISRARELTNSRQAGALWQAETEIAQIEESVPDQRERIQLESLKAEIHSRYDLQLVNRVITRMRCGALAFSPDGKRLAMGQRKHGSGFTVNIFETAALEENSGIDGEATKPVVPSKAYVVSTLGNAFSKLLSGDSRYQDGARSLAWSPDGKWLVVGSRFGQLTRWDTRDQKAEGISWRCGDRPVANLFFSADGRKLYSMSNELREWDCLQNWTELHQDAAAIDDVVMLPNSKTLLAHLRGSNVNGLVDGDTRELIQAWPDAVTMRSMAISPDGRLAAGLEEGGVNIRIAGTGEQLQTVASTDEELEFDETSLAFLNGELIAARDNLRRLHIWEVGNGRPIIQPISSADDGVLWTYDPLNCKLVLTDVESRDLIKIYQLRAPTNVRAIIQHGQPRAVDFSTDSGQLAIVSTGTVAENVTAWTELSRWSLDESQRPVFARAEHRDHLKLRPPFGIAWKQDSQKIAWFVGTDGILVSDAGRDGAHHFLSATGAKNKATLVEPLKPKKNKAAMLDVVQLRIGKGGEGKMNANKAMLASWSPNSRNLWTLVDDRKELVVRNVDTLEALGGWSNKHNDITTGLATIASLSVGPEFVLCGGENGNVTILPNKLFGSADEVLESLDEFRGPGGCVNAIAQSPSGSSNSSPWTLVGTQTGKVQIYALPSGDLLTDVQSEHGSVQSVAISSSGQLIVTGGEDGVLRLMNLDNQWQITPWLTLPSHFNSIDQVRFSNDDRYLAVAGRPARHVLVWDLSQLKDSP